MPEPQRPLTFYLCYCVPRILPQGLPAYAAPHPVQRAACSHPRVHSSVSPLTGSLTVLLDNLQGLSEAIAKDDAICLEDNQNTKSPPSNPLLGWSCQEEE